MKNTILTIAIVFSGMLMQAQDEFLWEYVLDGNGTKTELYNKAQIVIADTYNSANDVTQLSDIENGIVIKAQTSKTITQNGGFRRATYTFRYTLKMQFKDGRYKIIIDNVHNNIAPYGCKRIPVTSHFTGSMWTDNVTKSQHKKLMQSLRRDLTLLIESIKYDMEKELITDNDW